MLIGQQISMKRQLILISLIPFLGCGQTQQKPSTQSIDTSLNKQSKATMLDVTKLTEGDKKILADFHIRRKIFNNYIKDKEIKLFTCPGCGYPTLTERGSYEICDVCNWEDDNQDDDEADKVWGGPNANLSLTENRINIGKILITNSESLKSAINLDPSYVLRTLKLYQRKKEEIESKMTGNETLEHPIWTEWKQVEKDLQMALCRNK
jgi:hypothetical protein